LKRASYVKCVGEEILGKVYEAVTEKRVQKIRSNKEMLELYKTPDLLSNIKGKIWSGWGHVIKMA
jgi:hypothetical protein